MKFNLTGQTALHVDGAWARQSQVIGGFCKFAAPHMVVRGESLAKDLKLLTQQVSLTWHAPPPAQPPPGPALSEIYDTEPASLTRKTYAAVSTNFGFKPLKF